MPLLVPIDLSAPSRNAVELAVRLAPVLDGDVVLLHVSEGSPPLDLLADLHALAQPLHDSGVRVRLRTVRGDPAEAIAREAERRECDWIIMGSRGVHAHGGSPTGSVAQAVMLISSVPVAAIRPGNRGLTFDDGLPVAVVSGSYGSAADHLGRILAAALQGHTRPFRPNPAARGPLLVPMDHSPEDYGAAVLSFDPHCQQGRWCTQVIGRETRPVVLVCDPKQLRGALCRIAQ